MKTTYLISIFLFLSTAQAALPAKGSIYAAESSRKLPYNLSDHPFESGMSTQLRDCAHRVLTNDLACEAKDIYSLYQSRSGELASFPDLQCPEVKTSAVAYQNDYDILYIEGSQNTYELSKLQEWPVGVIYKAVISKDEVVYFRRDHVRGLINLREDQVQDFNQVVTIKNLESYKISSHLRKRYLHEDLAGYLGKHVGSLLAQWEKQFSKQTDDDYAVLSEIKRQIQFACPHGIDSRLDAVIEHAQKEDELEEEVDDQENQSAAGREK